MTGAALERWEGDLTAPDGTRLRARRLTPPEPIGRVLFVHGYSEHGARHGELYGALVARGLAVHGFDLRGHGRSAGPRGFVRDFDTYLADLAMLRTWAGEGGDRPFFLLGHSLGGLIVLRSLLARPAGVRAAAVSSPFLDLAVPVPRARLWFWSLVGRLFPGARVENPMRVERLTSDPELQRETEADPLYNRITSPGWFAAVRRAQAEVRAGAPSLGTPLLVMQAGADQVASPEAARRLYEALPGPDKDWALFPGFQHELFRERGRAGPFDRAAGWFAAHLP